MELYQLKTFVTVAREGHLTRAANKLFISQPAVSAHIKALEEELGIILFSRTPKGMELTREGKVLMEQAETALVTVKEIRVQAASLKKTPSGEFRMGIHIEPAFLKISEFFTIMQKEFPGLNFHLTQAMSWEVLDDIKEKKLDAGFIYGKSKSSEIISFLLCRMNLCVVGPVQWKAKLENKDWNEIAKLPWIWTPPQCPFHDTALNLFKKLDLKPLKAAVADQEPILNTLVQSGAGITLMIEPEARIAEKEGKIIIWKHAVSEIELSFAYHKMQEKDPVLQGVLSGIQRAWDLEKINS